MRTFSFNRGETNLFNQQHLNLVYNQEVYIPYIQRPISLDAVETQMALKSNSFSKVERETLHDALISQYEELNPSEKVKENISSLKQKNTFTITTGHQLSLLTGPLFFVVKILHVIKQCELLKEQFPESHFVPIFWMATEDHDFEEIQSTNLFNNKLKWESSQKGPVGRFNLEGLDEVKNEFSAFFSNSEGNEIEEFITHYSGKNLAEATRNAVNHLFGDRGLLILDGDDRLLKSAFQKVVEKEFTEQFSNEAVLKTNNKLLADGAHLQVNSREVNLFYIDNQIRERIIFEENKFVIPQVGEFDLNGIIELLKKDPTKFSPNVILRPVYQELILPNLVYVGGGGEISYWLQLKGVFDSLGLTYPLIQLRNSVMWIDENMGKKLDKYDLKIEDLFKDKDLLKKEYIELNESESLDFSFLDRQKEMYIDAISKITLEVDSQLSGFLNGELVKVEKQIEGVKSKLVKASKLKHDGAMKTIDVLYDRLFPNNSLQERNDNFFQLCAKGNVKEQIQHLYMALEPFNGDFLVVREI